MYYDLRCMALPLIIPGMSIGIEHGGTPAPEKKVLEGVLDKLKKWVHKSSICFILVVVPVLNFSFLFGIVSYKTWKEGLSSSNGISVKCFLSLILQKRYIWSVLGASGCEHGMSFIWTKENRRNDELSTWKENCTWQKNFASIPLKQSRRKNCNVKCCIKLVWIWDWPMCCNFSFTSDSLTICEVFI